MPTSDLSTTSSRMRWRSGFVYGGLLAWSSCTAIQFPELRPNGCGVLLGRQATPFDIRSLAIKVGRAKDLFHEDWDYGESNHFIGLYRRGKEWFYLLHGGTKSIRDRLGLFEGGQADSRYRLFKGCSKIQTPDGALYALIGDDAEEYYHSYKKAENEIKRRREEIGCYLFPESEVIFHETHQGLFSPTLMALGVYVTTNSLDSVPFMVTHGEPLFLLKGGLELDIESFPVQENLRVVPHGSGDYLPDLCDFEHIVNNGERLYRFHLRTGEQITADSPCCLREGHRSRQSALQALERSRVGLYDQLEHVQTIRM